MLLMLLTLSFKHMPSWSAVHGSFGGGERCYVSDRTVPNLRVLTMF